VTAFVNHPFGILKFLPPAEYHEDGKYVETAINQHLTFELEIQNASSLYNFYKIEGDFSIVLTVNPHLTWHTKQNAIGENQDC
jgi:hypothetical protein